MQQFPQDNCNVLLVDHSGTKQSMATSPRAKLHDDPKVGSLEKGSMILGHIWRLEFGQDGNFLNDILHLVLGIFDINDFDRYRFTSAFIDSRQR